MKPISPDDVIVPDIPDFVVAIVNGLITQNYQSRGKRSVIKQSELIKIINAHIEDKDMCFDIKWLDFEELYRNVGWNVKYDAPGYNESYEETFEFTKKENK